MATSMARQTPPAARTNMLGALARRDQVRAGRSLEPISNDRPREMVASPFACRKGKQNSAYTPPRQTKSAAAPMRGRRRSVFASKLEARNPKTETNLTSERRKIPTSVCGLLVAPLGFVSNFGFRISNFKRTCRPRRPTLSPPRRACLRLG